MVCYLLVSGGMGERPSDDARDEGIPGDPLRRLASLKSPIWPRVWIGLRVALVLEGAWQGARRMWLPHERIVPIDSWLFPPLVLVAMPAMMALVVGAQRLNPLTARVWLRPSWRLFPFHPAQPLQFFHAVSYMLLAWGAVALCLTPWFPAHTLEAATTLAGAIGARVGVAALSAAFARDPHDGRAS